MSDTPVTNEEVEVFLKRALERSRTPREALVVWEVCRLVDHGRAYLSPPKIPLTFFSLGGGLTQRIKVSEVLWVTAAVGALMVLCWFLIH